MAQLTVLKPDGSVADILLIPDTLALELTRVVCCFLFFVSHPAILLFISRFPVHSASTSFSSFHERHQILEEKHRFLITRNLYIRRVTFQGE